MLTASGTGLARAGCGRGWARQCHRGSRERSATTGCGACRAPCRGAPWSRVVVDGCYWGTTVAEPAGRTLNQQLSHDLDPQAGPGRPDPDQPLRWPPSLLGRSPGGRRRTGGERWTPGARGMAAVEGRRGNKLIDSGEVCPLAGRACFRPSTADVPGASSSTGQRRSAGPRLGAGSQAWRATARGRSTTPHLSTLHLSHAGSAGVWECRGGRAAASWGLWATHMPGGRGRRACAPPAGRRLTAQAWSSGRRSMTFATAMRPGWCRTGCR
jgi:hypothetical protein